MDSEHSIRCVMRALQAHVRTRASSAADKSSSLKFRAAAIAGSSSLVPAAPDVRAARASARAITRSDQGNGSAAVYARSRAA